MRWLALPVLALALLAAGCGGGGSSSASSDTTSTETTTTASTDTAMTDTTSTDATSTDTTTPDLSGVLGNKDCLALASVGATMAQAFSGASGSGDLNTEELDQLASKVPDEIRADVQEIAKAIGPYMAKLKDIGIKSGTTPTAAQVQQLQAALTSLDQTKLTAASQRIEAWSQKNCNG